MMVTTHVAAGLLLAVSVATFAPDFAIPAAIGAIIGGILPDIDFLSEHTGGHYTFQCITRSQEGALDS
jgi:hypothetical protein